MRKEWQCINGLILKLIAIVTMAIDHIGAVLYPDMMWFRIIGRIAFPIFVFLMVEGFYHTSNIRKYELRMLIFVFVSEIPFDLAFSQTAFEFSSQNVFFTLFLGLLMLDLIRRVQKSHYVFEVLLLIGFMVLAYFLHTDYSCGGILLIYVFYKARGHKIIQAAALAAISLFVIGPPMECFSVLAFIPIWFYNGKRSFKSRDAASQNHMLSVTGKLAFYIFYPAHLLILHFLDLARYGFL